MTDRLTVSRAPRSVDSRIDWGFGNEAANVFDDLLELEPDLVPVRVAAEHKGGFVVWTEEGDRQAVAVGPLRKEFEAEYRLHVGDFAAARAGDPMHLVHLLPRHSKLARKASGRDTSEQIIAANLDTVFLILALDQELSVRRLERYLTLVREGGAVPIVVLTKRDLCEGWEAVVTELTIATRGQVVALSALVSTGLESLAPWLQPAQTIALVGSSGAGKSTLVNVLAQTALPTAAVRDDRKGRHTTTHRQLVALPSGAILIDTPGMREVGLLDATTGLVETFDDIAELAGTCRFRDCRHGSEPDCAVRNAVERKELDDGRFTSFLKLRAESESGGHFSIERAARASARSR